VRRFGLFRNLPGQFKLKYLFETRPALFYEFLYPTLFVVALIFLVVLSFHVVGKGTPVPTHVIIDQGR
jgi:hypothetical protein